MSLLMLFGVQFVIAVAELWVSCFNNGFFDITTHYATMLHNAEGFYSTMTSLRCGFKYTALHRLIGTSENTWCTGWCAPG